MEIVNDLYELAKSLQSDQSKQLVRTAAGMIAIQLAPKAQGKCYVETLPDGAVYVLTDYRESK